VGRRVMTMPAEYVTIRNRIQSDCVKGEHPGKEADESCLQYAKRMASIIYYERTGKTPQEAESMVQAYEAVEEYLRSRNEDSKV
jgi:hypothetical protein